MQSLLFTLVAILSTIYFFFKRRYGYWKRKKIIHPPPVPLLGNYGPWILQKITIHEMTSQICKQFPNEPMIGAYFGTEPVLIVQGPELVKIITTKDFSYFSGREIHEHITKEVATRNLFFTWGDEWKVLRQNMSPLFSSAKMKNMFLLIEKYSRDFEHLIDKEAKKPFVDIRTMFARFTMDCIGSCAFGIDPNVTNDKNFDENQFRKISDMIFDVSRMRVFKSYIRSTWPTIFYALGQTIFPDAVHKFFERLLLDVFDKRNNKPSSRNDFVDLMLSLKKNEYITGDKIQNARSENNEKVHIKVDNELLIAQCIILFGAGFETSATTSAFTLYELAKHPEIQDKVIAEVDMYLSKRNQLDYDCVFQLPYLEQCVDEALRLYPVLGTIIRELIEPYVLPTGQVLEPGLRVHLPVYHIQRDPRNFPDPESYRPERFYPEQRKNIKPSTYLPFGEGPRICIGMRFAKMQMMAGLVTVFKKYKVELADHMPKTITYEPLSVITQSSTGIFIKLIPRIGCENRLYS